MAEPARPAIRLAHGHAVEDTAVAREVVLSVSPSAHLPAQLSIKPSTRLSVLLSIHPLVSDLCDYPSAHLFIDPSIHPSMAVHGPAWPHTRFAGTCTASHRLACRGPRLEGREGPPPRVWFDLVPRLLFIVLVLLI